jgi:hypothetical protein
VGGLVQAVGPCDIEAAASALLLRKRSSGGGEDVAR